MPARQNRNSLLLFTIACLFLPPLNALAGKQTGEAKQYIFSRSSTQTNSTAFGFTGVPAYVNFPGGSQRRGVYVTSIAPGSRAFRMGLHSGTVLLTMDNHVVESPSAADSIASMLYGNVEISYVKMVGGYPKLTQAHTSLAGSTRTGLTQVLAFSAGRGGPMTKLAEKVPTDNSPLSTLESYMLTLINKDRASNGGLEAVSDNSKLADLARIHAEYLLTAGILNHNDADGRSPFDRAKAAGIAGGIAENLSMQPRGNKPDKELVAAAEAQMMGEAPNNPHNHRGNILWATGKSVGVGMARNNTTLIMVQDYSDN